MAGRCVRGVMMQAAVADLPSRDDLFACLPRELLVLALLAADTHTLGRVVGVSREMTTLVEAVLRARAETLLPTDTLALLFWRERRQWTHSAAHKIAAGDSHSACAFGELFTFGTDDSQRGYLGHGSIGRDPTVLAAHKLPLRIPMERERFVAVSTHSLHTLALTASGRVFSFGQGKCGQLGHGDEASVSRPRWIESLGEARVTEIAAGQQHSLVLTDAGEVRSFGSGYGGKLGHGDQRNHTTPHPIEGLAEWAVGCLAAGVQHSLAATKATGQLFTWGVSPSGHRSIDYTPRAIAELRARIVQLAAGEHHSLAIDDEGVCYSWGAGEAQDGTQSEWMGGWLGHRNVEERPLPTRISALNGIRIVAVAAGSRHTLVLADGGGVYSFGDGACGQLGHDDGGKMHWVPTRIKALDGLQVAAVAAGAAHSLCVLRDGRMLSWGCGGALGLEPAFLSDRTFDDTLSQSWGSSSGNDYERVSGGAGRRWQAHVPTAVRWRNDE